MPESSKGAVGKGHVHMHIEYPPSKSISGLAKGLKGRSSRLLQKEFSELDKRYWGKEKLVSTFKIRSEI